MATAMNSGRKRMRNSSESTMSVRRLAARRRWERRNRASGGQRASTREFEMSPLASAASVRYIGAFPADLRWFIGDFANNEDSTVILALTDDVVFTQIA